MLHRKTQHQLYLLFLFTSSVNSFLVPTPQDPKSSTMLSSLVPSLTPELVTQFTTAAVLGTFVDPVVEQVYNMKTKQKADHKDAIFFGAANSISNAARIYGILIAVDLFATSFDFSLPIENLSSSALPVSLTIWALSTVSVVKRSIFLSAVVGNRLGRVALYDRLFDFLIAVIGLVLIL